MADLEAPPDAGATLDRLLALGDRTRRDLFFFVVDRGGWVSRDEAAVALRIRRGLVAHHLDRLAADGLLEVEYRRLTGRSGPGAGRPAKLYRRADARLELAIPPRNPGAVGQMLAAAIRRAGSEAEPVRRSLAEVARDAGRALAGRVDPGRSGGERRRAVVAVLSDYGYAPRPVDGELRMANCPYEPLSERDRELVCGMNLALVAAVVTGMGVEGVDCRLRPPRGGVTGGCCVRVGPWPGPDDRSG